MGEPSIGRPRLAAGMHADAVDAASAPWSKAARVMVFFLLGLLVVVAFAGQRFWAALAVCSIVAGTDDLAQMLDAGREVDLVDWMADIVGVLLAGILFAQRRRTTPSRRRNPSGSSAARAGW
jgi:VanZ family protein